MCTIVTTIHINSVKAKHVNIRFIYYFFNLNTGKLAILNKLIYTSIIGISLCTNFQVTALGNFLGKTGMILAFAVLNFWYYDLDLT